MSKNFLVDGRPTLTVMCQAKTPERIKELIKKGLEGGADAFGIQLEQLERQYHTKEVYTDLFNAMGGKPAYVTNYRYHQNEGISDEALMEELLEISAMGLTLIDVPGDTFCKTEFELTRDVEAIEKQKDLIAKIHNNGSQVLMSSHIFKFLEYRDVLEVALSHKGRNVDVSKIVTGADNDYELNCNFVTTARLKNDLGLPFLFLCGGSNCQLHRRVAPVIANGMYLCVAEHDDLSTPTQPLLSEAAKIVKACI